MASDFRRHRRVTLRSPVRVTWQDRYGAPKFALARTLDISESGIRVELPEAVNALSPVGIQSERIALACSGVVRNCVRCASKYLIGIEFSGQVRLNRNAAGLNEPNSAAAASTPDVQALQPQ